MLMPPDRAIDPADEMSSVKMSGRAIGAGRLTEGGANPIVGGPGVQCVQQLGE